MHKNYVLGLDLGQSKDFTAIIALDLIPRVRALGLPFDLIATEHQGDPRFCIIGNDDGTQAVVPKMDLETLDPLFNVVHIERLPRGIRYPVMMRYVVDQVAKLRAPIEDRESRLVGGQRFFTTKEIQASVSLIVDYTGVGRPVADMLFEAQPDCDIIPLTITSGQNVTRDDLGFHVPKRLLASVVQRMLQESRLRVPRIGEMALALQTELEGFRVKITAKGNDTYGAGEDWRSAPHDDLVLALAMALWFGDAHSVVGVY